MRKYKWIIFFLVLAFINLGIAAYLDQQFSPNTIYVQLEETPNEEILTFVDESIMAPTALWIQNSSPEKKMVYGTLEDHYPLTMEKGTFALHQQEDLVVSEAYANNKYGHLKVIGFQENDFVIKGVMAGDHGLYYRFSEDKLTWPWNRTELLVRPQEGMNPEEAMDIVIEELSRAGVNYWNLELAGWTTNLFYNLSMVLLILALLTTVKHLVRAFKQKRSAFYQPFRKKLQVTPLPDTLKAFQKDIAWLVGLGLIILGGLLAAVYIFTSIRLSAHFLPSNIFSLTEYYQVGSQLINEYVLGLSRGLSPYRIQGTILMSLETILVLISIIVMMRKMEAKS